MSAESYFWSTLKYSIATMAAFVFGMVLYLSSVDVHDAQSKSTMENVSIIAFFVAMFFAVVSIEKFGRFVLCGFNHMFPKD